MTKIPSLLLGQRRCDWETDLCVSTEKGEKRGEKNEMETEEILQELENVEAEVRLVQGTLIIDFY